jgi:hypothetical protein
VGIIEVLISHLGMAMKEDGENSPEEPGRVGRRTVDVLIDPGPADIMLHQILLHGYRHF